MAGIRTRSFAEPTTKDAATHGEQDNHVCKVVEPQGLFDWNTRRSKSKGGVSKEGAELEESSEDATEKRLLGQVAQFRTDQERVIQAISNHHGKAAVALGQALVEMLADIPGDDAHRVPIFNHLQMVLREFVGLTEPCLSPQLVPAESVHANSYNPNTVAAPEMKLLHLSIAQDGLTQPVVAYAMSDGVNHETVDGFHRRCILRGEDRDGRKVAAWQDIPQRMRGLCVVVHIDKPLDERKASTVRHNRARGKHGVGPMSEMVQELFQAGWSDKRICEHLGMEPDEVLRLRQIGGLAELYADEDFSEAWE